MKKYNRSEIMKKAWRTYNSFKRCVEQYRLSFSECLKRAWALAKEEERKNAFFEANSYFYTNILGCEVHVNVPDGIISGRTYGIKKELKNAGFRWNPFEKYWESNMENTIDFVKSFI